MNGVHRRTASRSRGGHAARAAGALLALGLAAAAAGWPGGRPAAAQSPLSLLSLGAPVPSQDARMEGRGGWGAAESDTLTPGFKNLAGLVGLGRVALMISGFGERLQSDGDGAVRTGYRVMTPNLRAAIPLLGGRGALTAGFLGRRSTQFATARPMVWYGSDPQDTLATGQQRFLREGTQYEIPLGVAWRLAPHWSAAVSLNLARGMIRETETSVFQTPLDLYGNPAFRSSIQIREDQFRGTSATLALRAEPVAGLALGAVYTPPYDWTVDRSLELVGVGGAADTTFTWRLPAEWSAGAAFRFAPRWRVGLDWDLRRFSQFRGRSDWQAEMCDEWSVALGCEREQGMTRRAGLRNLPLRLGASLRRWGYLVGGGQLHETRLAVGTGFPFRSGSGHLDVAVSYGWVGSLAVNGYADRVWRLTLSAAGLEKWW